MSDLGHRLTDKELAKLERKIKSVYSEASKDIQKTIDDFFYGYDKEVDGEIIHFNGFYERDEEMRKLLEAGKLVPNGASASMTPEEYYQQWRLNNLARGERFAAMRDKLAERATQANEVAISYVNDATPSIYSLNRNYAAYTIESVADNVSFTLYDESTVRRLLTEDPETMPYYPPQRAVKRGIDLEYGKKQITATVTSGILQGKSIPGLADSLQDRIISMSRTSAVRAARTAVTSAQNGGRQDGYVAAEKQGIRLKKEWMATLDARTRFEHGMADGQKVDIDKPFDVGGEKLMFPADPNGSGWNTYNCRCTMVADLLDYPDEKPRETYSEWMKRKAPVLEIGQEETENKGIWIKTSGDLPHMQGDHTRWWQIQDPSWKERFERADSTLAQLQERYPLGADLYAGEYDSIDGLLTAKQVERKENGAASGQFWVNHDTNKFVIGFNPAGVSNTLEEDLRIREEAINEGKRLLSVLDNSTEGVMIHEYGHAYAEKLTVGMIYNDQNSVDYWDWYRSLTKEEIEQGLSWYATQSRAEFEAECFAELQCPNPRKLALKYKEFLVNCKYSCYIYDVDNPPIEETVPKFKIPNKVFGNRVITLPNK